MPVYSHASCPENQYTYFGSFFIEYCARKANIHPSLVVRSPDLILRPQRVPINPIAGSIDNSSRASKPTRSASLLVCYHHWSFCSTKPCTTSPPRDSPVTVVAPESHMLPLFRLLLTGHDVPPKWRHTCSVGQSVAGRAPGWSGPRCVNDYEASCMHIAAEHMSKPNSDRCRWLLFRRLLTPKRQFDLR